MLWGAKKETLEYRVGMRSTLACMAINVTKTYSGPSTFTAFPPGSLAFDERTADEQVPIGTHYASLQCCKFNKYIKIRCEHLLHANNESFGCRIPPGNTLRAVVAFKAPLLRVCHALPQD